MGFLSPQTSNTKPTRLYGFRPNTALAGTPIPIFYGTNRTSGNVIFASPLNAHAVVNQGGKGGKGASGGKDGNGGNNYYTADVVIALGSGQCQNIQSVWQEKTLIRMSSTSETITVPSSGP